MLDIVPFIFFQQHDGGYTILIPAFRLGLVVAVSISRGLSILTIGLVEKCIGLQVIEYDDSLELEVMRGLIGALPDACVEVSGDPNSLWEKQYLPGQAMGYGLDVETSLAFFHKREVVPIVLAAMVIFVYYSMASGGTGFDSLIYPLFVLMCLAKRREKCIVLRNREAGADQA